MTDTIQDRLRDQRWNNLGYYTDTAHDAAAHIDAQDAKIKALVEALGKLSFELGALEAFEAQVRREIGNTNYTAIMTRYEAARAALAAAKETT